MIALYLPLIVLPASAGEGGLYAAAPPPDAAFVRLLDRDPGPPMQIGGRSAGAPGVAGLTPYVASVGSAEIRTSAGPLKHSVSAGQWWTLVVDEGRLLAIADPAPPPATRASLVLYNLCEGEAALFTEDGSLELISGLGRGEVGQRLVNAQAVRLAVQRGDERLPLPDELLLRRGAVYSLVAQEGPAGRCGVTWQENQTRGQ